MLKDDEEEAEGVEPGEHGSEEEEKKKRKDEKETDKEETWKNKQTKNLVLLIKA